MPTLTSRAFGGDLRIEFTRYYIAMHMGGRKLARWDPI